MKKIKIHPQTFLNTFSFSCFTMQHKQKSRTLAKKQVKTPGAKIVTHYIERKPKGAVCAVCGTKLKGIPRGRPADIAKIAKSSRRPERPYGGVLCSACTRAKMKEAARQ